MPVMRKIVTNRMLSERRIHTLISITVIKGMLTITVESLSYPTIRLKTKTI
jgi:hypothetical protein